MIGWNEQQVMIQSAIKRFPATFALAAYPGETFRIGPSTSYVNDSGSLMLYTERLVDGKWLSFAKGTESELRAQVRPLPAPVPPVKKSLTVEQLKALRQWAHEHGRTWKSALRHAWETGNYDGFGQANFLQQIRNSFGPAWLIGFRFPAKPVYQMDVEELTDLKAQYAGRTDHTGVWMLAQIEQALKTLTAPTAPKVEGPHFDYVNQAWTVDGRYVACAHPDAPACKCYGNQHAGELAPIENLPTATVPPAPAPLPTYIAPTLEQWHAIVDAINARGLKAHLEGGGAACPFIWIDSPDGRVALLGDNAETWSAQVYANREATETADYSDTFDTTVPNTVLDTDRIADETARALLTDEQAKTFIANAINNHVAGNEVFAMVHHAGGNVHVIHVTFTVSLNDSRCLVFADCTDKWGADVFASEDALNSGDATRIDSLETDLDSNVRVPAQVADAFFSALVGSRFVKVLREWLTPEEWEVMRQRNAIYDDDVCASHDFCDANMAMDQAFKELGLTSIPDTPDDSPERERLLTVWNNAWTWAKRHHLTAPLES